MIKNTEKGSTTCNLKLLGFVRIVRIVRIQFFLTEFGSVQLFSECTYYVVESCIILTILLLLEKKILQMHGKLELIPLQKQTRKSIENASIKHTRTQVFPFLDSSDPNNNSSGTFV
ncbi:hypothetical protein BDC45DRAFT_530514 [Circinella umbellata]|nr:hypothetical protein BDC45DRAFT_530514 [Circinella umbellata]